MSKTLIALIFLTGCATPAYRVIEYDANSWYFGIGSGVVGGCRIEINQDPKPGVRVTYVGNKCQVEVGG